MDKKIKVYILTIAVAVAPLLIAYVVSRMLGDLSLIPYIFLAVMVVIWYFGIHRRNKKVSA